MIQYNPKEWFGLIFRFHKSDTFRILFPAMLCLGLYSGVVTFLMLDFFEFKIKSTPVVHSLLGFVISLLLVFRTNTAYDRWWEARKLWGALVNNSRNLSLKIKALAPSSEHSYFETIIGNFCLSLKHHLRNQSHWENLKACEGFDPHVVKDKAHLPNQMAMLLFAKANDLYKKGQFTGEQFLLMKEELTSYTDITGACERIKNTPIPYSYSLFIKKFIFIYSLTMPFGLLTDLGYWSVPIVMFVFYALASLEIIAEEIEEPFGKESNDLPTDSIVDKIKQSIAEIFAS